MTALDVPDLPDLLTRLTGLIPQRVLWSGGHSTAIKVWGEQHSVFLDEPKDLLKLEGAFREECDARGWRWVTQCIIGKNEPHRACKAIVYRGRSMLEAEAPTPAHAFAAALQQALEAPVVVVPDLYYFGCVDRWDGHGTYLGRRNATQAYLKGLDTGFLTDARIPEVPGRGVYLQVDGHSVVSFWDRSGDSRGNSNSAFFAKGEYSADDLLSAARERYPDLFARFPFEIRLENA